VLGKRPTPETLTSTGWFKGGKSFFFRSESVVGFGRNTHFLLCGKENRGGRDVRKMIYFTGSWSMQISLFVNIAEQD
jgi:hypothetical protein